MGFVPFKADMSHFKHLKYTGFRRSHSQHGHQQQNALGLSYEAEEGHVAAMAKRYMGFVPFKADMSHFHHLKYTGNGDRKQA